MRHPCPVVAGLHLAQLVRPHLLESRLVGDRVVLDRDLRRHPAHRVNPAPMARLDEKLHVGREKPLVHRDLRTIRQDRRGIFRALLDEAEDVVPSAAVEAGRVLAQLAEELVHLERRRKGLDEAGRLDRSAGDAEALLRADEHVVPQPGLEVALHLGQVEVRARPAGEGLLGVVEEEEAEVEEAPGNRLAVDLHVALDQVPAARPDEQDRGLLLERVLLARLGGRERDRTADGVAEVVLPVDQVVPGGAVGVFEIRHEDARAGVERVDDHLAVGGPGDLDAAIEQVLGQRRNGPVASAHARRSRGGSPDARRRRTGPGARDGARAAPGPAGGTCARDRRRRRARHGSSTAAYCGRTGPVSTIPSGRGLWS